MSNDSIHNRGKKRSIANEGETFHKYFMILNRQADYFSKLFFDKKLQEFTPEMMLRRDLVSSLEKGERTTLTYRWFVLSYVPRPRTTKGVNIRSFSGWYVSFYRSIRKPPEEVYKHFYSVCEYANFRLTEIDEHVYAIMI